MTTAQIVFAVSVLAVTALMVWAIRAAQVRESLPAMTAARSVSDGFGTEWPICGPQCDLHAVRPGKVQCNATDLNCPDRPTHVVLWACGHRETQRCDEGCQHSDEPWQSMLRCGDCIWKETDR